VRCIQECISIRVGPLYINHGYYVIAAIWHELYTSTSTSTSSSLRHIVHTQMEITMYKSPLQDPGSLTPYSFSTFICVCPGVSFTEYERTWSMTILFCLPRYSLVILFLMMIACYCTTSISTVWIALDNCMFTSYKSSVVSILTCLLHTYHLFKVHTHTPTTPTHLK